MDDWLRVLVVWVIPLAIYDRVYTTITMRALSVMYHIDSFMVMTVTPFEVRPQTLSTFRNKEDLEQPYSAITVVHDNSCDAKSFFSSSVNACRSKTRHNQQLHDDRRPISSSGHDRVLHWRLQWPFLSLLLQSCRWNFDAIMVWSGFHWRFCLPCQPNLLPCCPLLEKLNTLALESPLALGVIWCYRIVSIITSRTTHLRSPLTHNYQQRCSALSSTYLFTHFSCPSVTTWTI